jgi:hypothetical protein
MSAYSIGDEVKVALPRGKSKRGVVGVNVMYTTSQEAKFDGAVGVITDINPHGPFGLALYLVDFRDRDNSRIGIPWQAQWFREEWITLTKQREEKVQPSDNTAPAGFARTSSVEST